MEEFINIQHRLVRALMQISTMRYIEGRDSLLLGLPPVPLTRSTADSRLDLNLILDGLHKLGRLSDQSGTRPLIVVVNNALENFPQGGEVAHELNEVKRLLTEYYGGDIQARVITGPLDLEALIFGPQRDSRLAFSFIKGAMRTAQSVTRLTVPRIINGVQQPGCWGTGWLIAPGVVITNHHVIEARLFDEPAANPADFEAQAQGVEALFDYYQETGGNPVKCSGAQLLAKNKDLDYALIELKEASKVADRNPLPIVLTEPNMVRGSRMNIVQHPKGGPLQLAIRNNFFVRSGDTPEFIRYQTDTEEGASGSPVCDDTWRVVGLHHASTSIPKDQLKDLVPQEFLGGQPVTVTHLNEATAIHFILNDLPTGVKQRVLEAQPRP